MSLSGLIIRSLAVLGISRPCVYRYGLAAFCEDVEELGCFTSATSVAMAFQQGVGATDAPAVPEARSVSLTLRQGSRYCDYRGYETFDLEALS
eukprot:6075249-Pyramimonas_sp.AAC.1